MTEALSGDQFLPGVDWSQYQVPHEHLTEAQQGYEDERKYAKRYMAEFGFYPGTRTRPPKTDYSSERATKARANVPLEGLHTTRAGFTPEQEADEATGKAKLARLTEARPLAEGINTIETFTTDPNTGQRTHHVTGTVLDRHGERSIGDVQWSGETGKIAWVGVHPDYRYATHALLSRAHEVAQEHGDLGPLYSDTMSRHSFRLAQKFAPSFIPPGSHTEYEPGQ